MSTRTRIAFVAPALAAVTVLLLSACNSGTGSDAAAAPSGAATNGGQRTTQGQGQDPDRGGASGQIASVNGTVMQLRSTDAQTAVAWTGTTTFTAQVPGGLSDVTVGSCVVAVAVQSTSSSGSTSATPDTTSAIAATSIRITAAADDGTCAGGFGGGGAGGFNRQRPSGAPTDAPNDTRPSGAPTGAPGGGAFRGFGGVASGKVTAIEGSTLTVDAMGADNATTSRTVTVSSDTTYTSTKAADASAVVVGQCATARGQADASGKVTATSVTVSAPTDGSCSTRFGGDGFGPGGGPGGTNGGNDGSQQGGGTNA